jgi:hypothetical protein
VFESMIETSLMLGIFLAPHESYGSTSG